MISAHLREVYHSQPQALGQLLGLPLMPAYQAQPRQKEAENNFILKWLKAEGSSSF